MALPLTPCHPEGKETRGPQQGHPAEVWGCQAHRMPQMCEMVPRTNHAPQGVATSPKLSLTFRAHVPRWL